MRTYDEEGDLSGPGVDLALSFSGVLMIVVVLVASQLWLTSVFAKRSIAAGSSSTSDGVGELRASFNRTVQDLKDATARWNVERQRANIVVAERDIAQKNFSRLNDELTVLRSALVSARNDLDRERDRVRTLESQLVEEKKKRETLEVAIASATRQASALSEQIRDLRRSLTDKPPLITISDAAFQTFEEASAELRPELKQFLKENIGQLYDSRNRYGAKVIEVVGHTDEVRLSKDKRLTCNLDESLLPALNDPKPTTVLTPCDNVGLGMARATAVVNELARLGLAKDFVLLPLSAGATIDTDGMLALGNQSKLSLPARRRIEIRLRRE